MAESRGRAGTPYILPATRPEFRPPKHSGISGPGLTRMSAPGRKGAHRGLRSVDGGAAWLSSSLSLPCALPGGQVGSLLHRPQLRDCGPRKSLDFPENFFGERTPDTQCKSFFTLPIVCVRCPQRALLRHHCAVVFNIRMFRSWHRSHGQHDVRRHHAECLNRSLLYEPACSPTFVSYPSNETAGAQATKRPHGLLVQICIEFCTLWPQPAQCCPRATPPGVSMLSSRAS